MIVEAKSALICKSYFLCDHPSLTLTMKTRTEDVIDRHLHLYNGILEFVPSLRDELDTISTDRLSKIISAVSICALYMTICALI